MIEEVGNDGINVRKKALIIIDMQKDYLWDKRKPIFNYDTESPVGNVNRVIDLYKNEGVNVVSDYFFEKNRLDTFTAKTFREFIKRQRYKEVTLCGLDICRAI